MSLLKTSIFFHYLVFFYLFLYLLFRLHLLILHHQDLHFCNVLIFLLILFFIKSHSNLIIYLNTFNIKCAILIFYLLINCTFYFWLIINILIIQRIIFRNCRLFCFFLIRESCIICNFSTSFCNIHVLT